MLTKLVDGVEVQLSAQEEAEILADRENSINKRSAERLESARAKQKEKLIRQKVESMLTVEFEEIDAATTTAAAKAVTIKV